MRVRRVARMLLDSLPVRRCAQECSLAAQRVLVGVSKKRAGLERFFVLTGVLEREATGQEANKPMGLTLDGGESGSVAAFTV